MTPKAKFLYRLVIQIEYADKAAKAKDADEALQAFAHSLRSVHDSEFRTGIVRRMLSIPPGNGS